ncbi:MAG: PH domain-containing protein [Pirellulales bacterium]|nr:PH domain-containing protein [Pirellulales bacterium]
MSTSQPGKHPAAPAGDAASTPSTAERFRQAATGRLDAPEEDVWQGSYSPRAMIDTWAICGLVTLAALIAAAILLHDPLTWTAVVVAIVVIWSIPVFTLLYRRMSISYRLTTQRLFHEHGILSRTIDRTELIRIDDLSIRQGLFERLITGTGTIKVISSRDATDKDLELRGIENVRDVFSKIDAARRNEKTRRSLQVDEGYLPPHLGESLT